MGYSLGFMATTLGVLGICSPLDSIRGGFFSFASNYAFCGSGEKVFRFTVPTFNSIAYSLGAWVPLRFGRIPG
jgi:hypothetical protein